MEAEGNSQRGFLESCMSTANSENVYTRPEVTNSACVRDQAAPKTSGRGVQGPQLGDTEMPGAHTQLKGAAATQTQLAIVIVGTWALCDI